MIRQWNLLAGGIVRSRDATVNAQGHREWFNYDPPDLKDVPANERRTIVVVEIELDDDDQERAKAEAREIIDEVLKNGVEKSEFTPMVTKLGDLAVVRFTCDFNDTGYELLTARLHAVRQELA